MKQCQWYASFFIPVNNVEGGYRNSQHKSVSLSVHPKWKSSYSHNSSPNLSSIFRLLKNVIICFVIKSGKIVVAMAIKKHCLTALCIAATILHQSLPNLSSIFRSLENVVICIVIKKSQNCCCHGNKIALSNCSCIAH